MNPCDVVVFSTADFDNPFWTNKQHVATDLARRGFRVLYVDSIGLRRPSASAADLRRIARRVLRGLRGPQRVRENLWVVSPLTIPLQRFGIVRALNGLMLRGGLRVARAALGFRDPTLWTYNPLTTELLDLSAYDRVVYHCVDDIAAQPGMPAATIQAADRDLTIRADVVFATSLRLEEVHAALNPRTHYFPNCVDAEHFGQALAAETVVPADLAALPGPRIGVIGALSSYKLDFELIRAVAEAHPEWSVVMIGQVGEGDPWTRADALGRAPNLHLLGPRAYGDLPAYLKGLDAAMIPAPLNDYTRSMFPMKFFEYLAAGRPVVTTALPALRDFAHVATIAADAPSFIAGLEAALAGKGPSPKHGRAVAAENTYARRGDHMLACVADGPLQDRILIPTNAPCPSVSHS